MDEGQRLGERLRARRMELGLTLAAVATEAGLSVPYVANLEKGRGNPTLDSVVALAAALEVTPGALLSFEELQRPIDTSLATLPPGLADYSRSRAFAGLTQRLAAHQGVSPKIMRTSLLRALANAPRPQTRELTQRDYERLLDACTLILTDPP
jgi:transcriptional regulator with XRE-family HTH domain